MNNVDMFRMMGPAPDEDCDTRHYVSPSPMTPAFYNSIAPSESSWEDLFQGFKSRPLLYNIEGYCSPYASDNWVKPSRMLSAMDDRIRIPAVEEKIDPNRIFNSELNGLRTIESDQNKITKLFEKRLMESLTEKGKVGLTEEDIEAMATLNAARANLTSINKEKTNIKKTIAELKIKQQAQNATNATADGGSGKGGDVNDFGLSMLDNIFKISDMRPGTTSPTPVSSPTPPTSTPNETLSGEVIPTTPVEYVPEPGSSASDIIDAIIPDISAGIRGESKGVTLYAVFDDSSSDSSYKFEAYDKDHNLVSDYDIPSDLELVTVNHEGHIATDNRHQEIPIMYRDEI